jgi:ribosomal protein S21
MPLEVKKQNKETSQALVRRFSKKVQQSGILIRARSVRYKDRNRSEEMKKRSALRREQLRKEYEIKEKVGELLKAKEK